MSPDPNNPARIAELFWRDGIVILEDFYPARQSSELAMELDAAVALAPDKPFGGGPNYARERETRVRTYPGADKPLAEQATRDPRLEAITLAICGANHVVGHIAIFSTHRDGCQAWHQDTRSREPGQYELNRIIFPSTIVPEQGPLYYVPRSHLGPDLPPGGNHEPLPDQIECSPKAGTLVLMHTRCFHRVGINQTDRWRTQCNRRVRPATAAAPGGLSSQPVFRSGPWNFATDKAE